MARDLRWLSCLLLALVACKYEPVAATDFDGNNADTPVPDAGPCQQLGPTCAGTTLRTCVNLGELPDEVNCGWGCDGTGTARCIGIVPGGGSVSTADLDRTMFNNLTPVTLNGATIDSDAETIDIGGGVVSFDHRSTATVTIFRFKSLTISAAVTLTGGKAIALVADGPIVIDGVIDAHGCGGGGQTAGPGGHNGANAGASAALEGGGLTSGNSKGAGGGGYGGTGGAGGGSGGLGGPPFGTTELLLLVGGGGGGGGKGNGGGRGGGGGGAIQLVSNTSITINGGVDAGGCGGEGGGSGGSDSGGGGGAGGAILLEAPTISIMGSVDVNGGGGGGSDNGGNGGDGTLDRIGGTAGTKGGSSGALGGTGGAAAVIDGGVGGTASLSGGGGGAVGRMRFNTLTGMVTIPNPMTLSPNLTDVPTTCTKGSATIQ